jgi:HAMP domain-containing protein
MNTGESQWLWVGLAILVLLIFFGAAGICLAFGINRKMRELLRIATEIEAMVGQIRLQAPSSTPPKPAVRRAQVPSRPKPLPQLVLVNIVVANFYFMSKA